MDTSKSSVRTNPKPINVFYVWYTELCRRINCTPAPAVKPAKPKCQTVLDFVADRLRLEEWNPIINALRHDTSLHVIQIKSRIGNCQFLQDVDTEEKAKHMKRRFGLLWTAYVLKQLTKSLSISLRHTEVLTVLELDGLPMFSEYLESLLQALKKNKTIKSLSFANCPIKDVGCQLVCAYLRFTPNVEVINLSGCGLTVKSGEHLAKLIKYQQINRYCESWHNSLRYEDPMSGVMRGIKRLTINCNPDLGDNGFNYILDELEDDLWIKALDVQKCGITEHIGNKTINIVEYNKSLEIVDLRQNEMMCIATIHRILQILREKQFGHQPEYQWGNTAVSLTWNSVRDSSSKFSFTANNLYKTKSAPMGNLLKNSTSTFAQPVRKSKTVQNVSKRTDQEKNQLNENKRKVLELNCRLEAEIQKRKEIEKRNEVLEHKLEEIQSATKTDEKSSTKTTLKTIISAIGIKAKGSCATAGDVKKKDKPKKYQIDTSKKNGYCNKNPQECTGKGNGYKNGLACNGVVSLYKNGYSSKVMSDAYKILETLVNSGSKAEVDVVEDKNLLSYYINDADSCRTYTCEKKDVPNDVSDSQVSLINYMEELKLGDSAISSTNRNATCNSKYFIKENQKR